MLTKIKELFKDTAVYGISTIIGRFLGFILVPFYTHYLSEADFGIYSNIYAYIAFFNIIYIYGMDAAFLKYSSIAESDKKKDVFSTAYWIVFLTSFFLSAIIIVFKTPFVFLMQVPNKYNYFIWYVVFILFFDTLVLVPFANLRLKRKAGTFVFIKMSFIIINIALILVFILKYKYGIDAIFLSNLLASFITFLMVLPEILRNIKFKIDKTELKKMLKFGLPYLPASLSATVVQVIDRPILTAITNDAVVGIYTANYKLGIFMMLFVSMFQYAWQPFFLLNAKEKNAKEIFSKILTLFVLAASIIWVIVTLFVDNFAKLKIGHSTIIAEPYWSGLTIVPIILLAYVFHGMYVNFNAGIYIEEKTKYLPYITFLGAAINILANLILIPFFSLFGAAVATLLSYLAMSVSIYFTTQKFYKINYEIGKISKIFTLIISVGAIYYYFYFNNLLSITNKFIVIIFYFIMLYILKVINKKDLEVVKRIVFKKG